MVIPALSILGLLSCARRCSATSFQIVRDVNTTVIDYEPPEVWKHLPGDCDGCTSPPSSLLLANSGTWTNGTNILKTQDADDIQPKGKDSVITQKDKGKGDDNDSDTDDGPDSDDPNFVPTPVTVTFRFNASAFVLHALVPTFILPRGAPSNTNVSFMLDGISTGPAFTFIPTADGQGFKDQQVLRLSGLENTQHVVVGSLAPGSTLIVSYVNLTIDDSVASQTSETLTSESITNDRLATSLSSAPAASSSAPRNTKKNVVSFAVAIGVVVGVLSILSFGTFVSLLCRRIKARKRLALLRAEQEEAEIREFGGRVYGPRPFVPRYFPGTLPPFDPEEEENNIPPSYESNEGRPIMISPLPPPPPPPPPPPILTDTLQVREISDSTPVSISTRSSPPLSLRRSSVISSLAPNYTEFGEQGSIPNPEVAETSATATDPIEEELVEREPSLSSRGIRSQPSGEIREDDTSDCESGGLLSSNIRDHSPSRSDSNIHRGESH